MEQLVPLVQVLVMEQPAPLALATLADARQHSIKPHPQHLSTFSLWNQVVVSRSGYSWLNIQPKTTMATAIYC